VGESVGLVVGMRVGVTVGKCVGVEVGEVVGFAVVAAVGLVLGFVVGLVEDRTDDMERADSTTIRLILRYGKTRCVISRLAPSYTVL
jgi:outer membrane lipoprotein SlyB